MNSIQTKTLFCIALLSTFAISCVGPSSAAASTTAYTCAATESAAGFSDAHCLTASGGTGFKHVAITEETNTTFTNANTAAGTSAAAPSTLKGALSGVPAAVQCSSVGGSGTIKNFLSGEESVAVGSGTLEYSGCTVTEPAGKSCKVKNGEFKTKSLSATTEGQGLALKLSPTSGTELTSVTIESCTIAALNNTFPVTGSLKATPIGATLSTAHAEITAGNTLKFGGVKAGFEGTLTPKGPSTAGIVFAEPPADSSTVFTCIATETGAQFTDAHCLTAGSGKGFKHVAIGETTSLSGTNANTAASTTASAFTKIRGVLSGVEAEVECTSVAVAGAIENAESETEKVVQGTAAVEYGGCSVNKPAGKSCSVKSSKFTTKSLTFTTEKQSGAIAVSPAAGTELANVTIEGCSIGGLNNTFALTGSLRVTPTGSTLSTNHSDTTTENTLKWGGQKAGIDGSATIMGKTIGGEEPATSLTIAE